MNDKVLQSVLQKCNFIETHVDGKCGAVYIRRIRVAAGGKGEEKDECFRLAVKDLVEYFSSSVPHVLHLSPIIFSISFDLFRCVPRVQFFRDWCDTLFGWEGLLFFRTSYWLITHISRRRRRVASSPLQNCFLYLSPFLLGLNCRLEETAFGFVTQFQATLSCSRMGHTCAVARFELFY